MCFQLSSLLLLCVAHVTWLLILVPCLVPCPYLLLSDDVPPLCLPEPALPWLLTEIDACTEACAKAVCVNQHQVPAWNDACLKRCAAECLKGRGTS